MVKVRASRCMVLDVWYKWGSVKRTFTSIWWLWICMYNIRCYFPLRFTLLASWKSEKSYMPRSFTFCVPALLIQIQAQ